MKHKNTEMIKAVVDNIELVVLTEVIDPEDENKNYWSVSNLGALVVASNKFFLCLPQHKEACLHWLNGGELYINNGKGLGEGNYTLSIKRNNPLADFIGHPEYQFRIKPKKEKRTIVVYENIVCFVNPDAVYPKGCQFIEIEVEV